METTIEQEGDARLVRISLTCQDCSEPLAFVGLPTGVSSEEPTVSADQLEARLPVVPAYSGTTLLQCPECGRILTGEGLDRPMVLSHITCGEEHILTWSDGQVFSVYQGQVTRVDEVVSE